MLNGIAIDYAQSKIYSYIVCLLICAIYGINCKTFFLHYIIPRYTYWAARRTFPNICTLYAAVDVASSHSLNDTLMHEYICCLINVCVYSYKHTHIIQQECVSVCHGFNLSMYVQFVTSIQFLTCYKFWGFTINNSVFLAANGSSPELSRSVGGPVYPYLAELSQQIGYNK